MSTERLTVSTLMIPLDRYPHIAGSAPLKEAIATMRRGLEQPSLSGFRRLLVIGDDGTLVGTLRLPDALRGLEPTTLRATPGNAGQGFATPFSSDSELALELFWDRVLREGFTHEPDRAVAEVAEPVRATVGPEEPVSRALLRLLQHDRMMMPVVAGGQVLGVVRLVDIFERVASLAGGGQA